MFDLEVGTGTQTLAPRVGDRPLALRVHLLGRFQVARGRTPVPPHAWNRRRPADLLKLLAATPGHALPRGRVVEALWPGRGPEAGAGNLHRALYDLRRVLGGAAVDLDGRTVRLPPGAWVDVDAFEAAVARGDRASLEEAVSLYRGDLAPEDRGAPWLASRREALRRRFAEAAWPVASRAASDGDAATALALLPRILEVAPSLEEAWRLWLRLLAESGRRAEAVRRYDACEVALRARGGPSPGTRALLDGILAGDVGPSRPGAPWDGRRHLAIRLTGSPEPLPLRGRASTLALLDGLLARGHGALVVLGEAGVGKTRLALEGARLAQERGAVVLAGEPGPEPASLLRSALGGYGEARGLPGPDPFAPGGPGLDPEAALDRLLASLPGALRAVGAGRPLYLVADDLHRADAASLRLLHLLVESASALGLFLVATCRDDEVAAGTPLQSFLARLDSGPLARGVRLPRLPLAATREMLADLLGAAPPGGLAERVQAATDGNPFHVEQLARSFREFSRLEVSASPAEAVRARAERLGPRVQAVLAAAAVAGDPFDAGLLRPLAALGGRDLLLSLARCEGAGLLAGDGRRWRFRSPLVREAVLERIPPGRLAELRRAAGAPQAREAR
jgi:DNA-binding SARP family transcriptional activator